jgi:NAD(P)-dependent dehydrogenase (short-subunit alcohol dehydrogenase family)
MMLEDKVAVIYGAAGAIGSTAAHAFAREGARVFLTGRQHQNSIKSHKKFLPLV